MAPFGILSSLLMLITYVQSQYTNKVVCYYGSWSIKKEGEAKFSPEDVDPFVCTHIVYAFADIRPDYGIIPGDEAVDIQLEGYARIVRLKERNPDLKVMLGMGGLKEGSIQFSRMTADPEMRGLLVNTSAKFLRSYGFDGLDVDWQFPGFRGGTSADKENYVLLIKELRSEFEREAVETNMPRLLLTMVAPQIPEYIVGGYNLLSLTPYVDFLNVLGYDFHLSDEPQTDHHAPLFSLPEDNINQMNNVDYIVREYIELGLYPPKLVLGIPAYGRTYTLADPSEANIGAPSEGEGPGSDGSWETGAMSYSEICRRVQDEEGWTVQHVNSSLMGPFAYKDNVWVSYDDEDAVKLKANYVKAFGLGGVMFWSLDHMDAKGACRKGTFPLVRAAREVLGLDNVERSPTSDPDRTPNATSALAAGSSQTGQPDSTGSAPTQATPRPAPPTPRPAPVTPRPAPPTPRPAPATPRPAPPTPRPAPPTPRPAQPAPRPAPPAPQRPAQSFTVAPLPARPQPPRVRPVSNVLPESDSRSVSRADADPSLFPTDDSDRVIQAQRDITFQDIRVWVTNNYFNGTRN